MAYVVAGVHVLGGSHPMRVCLAAHFPPVIVLPGQPAELARAASGLLIGLDGLS